MAQITKDTMIGELLRDQEHIDSIAEVLFGIGMHLSLIHISEPTRH